MANRPDKRTLLSTLCCVFGIILVLIAIVLVTVSFAKPLWTAWGRAEYSRNVHNAYDTLFKTEKDALREMGLPENCTSVIEERTLPENGTHEVKRWVCPTQSDNDLSCATDLYLTQPLTIGTNGGLLYVVEFSWTNPPEYQFSQQAACAGSPGLCAGQGRCLLESRIEPLLVSPKVISSMIDLVYAVYDNKVWFESYEFPGCCKCIR